MPSDTPRRVELNRPITRRPLLGAAASAAVVGSATLGRSTPRARAAGGGKHVVVLGGGLAGLCAAYELRARGYTIDAVLEAQQRTGGRVHTLRAGFANGQYAELGATRIASSHYYTLAYIDQFGLTKREFTNGDGLYYLKGQTPFVHTDGTAWPPGVVDGLSAADATLGADAISWKYDRGDIISDPANPGYLGDPRTAARPFDNANAAALAATSYHQYWTDAGGSEDAFLLNRAIQGSEIHSDGALYWVGADILDATWSQTWAIAGGNDQLPAAFADALGDIVKRRCQVTAIHNGTQGARVPFLDNGRHSHIDADIVVCTIPFSVLRDVKISPKLPDDKSATIQTMRYMPVSR